MPRTPTSSSFKTSSTAKVVWTWTMEEAQQLVRIGRKQTKAAVGAFVSLKLSVTLRLVAMRVTACGPSADGVASPSDHSMASATKDAAISRPPADYLDYYQMASTAGEACPPLSVVIYLRSHGGFRSECLTEIMLCQRFLCCCWSLCRTGVFYMAAGRMGRSPRRASLSSAKPHRLVLQGTTLEIFKRTDGRSEERFDSLVMRVDMGDFIHATAPSAVLHQASYVRPEWIGKRWHSQAFLTTCVVRSCRTWGRASPSTASSDQLRHSLDLQFRGAKVSVVPADPHDDAQVRGVVASFVGFLLLCTLLRGGACLS